MTASDSSADPRAELARQLAQLLAESNLSEVELTDGDLRIRLARTLAAPVAVAPAPVLTVPVAHAAAIPAAPAHEDNPLLSHPGLITSPMVGVVYTSPEPDAPPFVHIGETVAEGTTLLLIEAMKVFNPITAPRAGRVTRIMVANGAPVEYGEPLLVIE